METNVLKKRDEIFNMKMKLAENTRSLVLVPLTEESDALAELTLIVDKYIDVIRKKMGLSLPYETATRLIEDFKVTIEELYSILDGIKAPKINSTTENKLAHAKLSYTKVLIPRTVEGRIMAYTICKVNRLVKRATKNGEFDKIDALRQVIAKLDSLLAETSKKLEDVLSEREKKKIFYKRPAIVSKILVSNSTPEKPR